MTPFWLVATAITFGAVAWQVWLLVRDEMRRAK